MRLNKIYARFFRSFNFDYERKAREGAQRHAWEMIDTAWYPFVRVQVEPDVTAVVGANESGKSHLIDAIKQALTGEKIGRDDFCRYSSLFSVEVGRVRVPDLGVEVEVTTEEESARLGELEIRRRMGDTLTLLRLHQSGPCLLEPDGELRSLGEDEAKAITDLLPRPFELKTDVALPDAISFDALLDRELTPFSRRRWRAEFLSEFTSIGPYTPESITNVVPRIHELLASESSRDHEDGLTSDDLARSLLFKIARIDRDAIKELETALRNEREGRAEGLIEVMNQALARHLNFNRFWTQDKDFQLRIEPRERELVFVIRDRTGTNYSFNERSKGLRYFLSYYVQLRAHDYDESRSEILLMDEPDAYLSSLGQLDLLRALESFARPDASARQDQVLYVTHSPFLINKNAAHQIRVLDKGTSDEGTRVVRDVARNHYEPLRSSIGSYVAETAFIGGDNLIVEGASDQVLLTGMSEMLRRADRRPTELIDLNAVTIVPAGSADSVPYMAYLARGRDQIKPPCVALLDGDEAGRAAQKKLARSAMKSGRIIDEKYVVVLSDWATNAELDTADGIQVREPEDLVPVSLAVEAAQRYAKRFIGLPEDDLKSLKVANVTSRFAEYDGKLWDSLEAAFSEAYAGGHIEKVGFSKELVLLVREVDKPADRRHAGLNALEQNFAALIAYLAECLRRAHTDEVERRRSRRVDRHVKAFIGDYPSGTSRDIADRALREIEASLEDSDEAEEIIAAIAAIRRRFELSRDPLAPVDRFEEFCERLKHLPLAPRLANQDPAD